MGKRIDSQRQGRGGLRFRFRHANMIRAAYHSMEDLKQTPLLKGEIVELVKETGRSPILTKILLENGKQQYSIAPEGVAVGDTLELGDSTEVAIGNVLYVKNIPEGCPIFNIEKQPGDGGKLVRSTGEYAIIVIKGMATAEIKLPSGKIIRIPLNARATIGCVAGGMRKEKPMMKAGTKHHFMHARNRLWPRTRGVAKNPHTHPFGGSQHHVGKSKSVSRHAPPGRKVGAIASKRTGRKKK